MIKNRGIPFVDDQFRPKKVGCRFFGEIQLTRMRLQKGRVAPNFRLPTIDQYQISLQDFKGKKVLLVLNRWANCPFCSLTLNRIVNNSSKFQELGVAVMMVFPSSADKIRKSLPNLDAGTTHFLSDEDLETYRMYGTDASFSGEIRSLLDLPNLAQALKHMKASSIFYDGKFTQLPCSVMINESGIIDEINYGKSFTDVIDPRDVMGWASLGGQSGVANSDNFVEGNPLQNLRTETLS